MASDSFFDMQELLTLEKILALVGGILVLVSVFLAYWAVSGDLDDSWSGMDKDIRDPDNEIVKLDPIITMVFGILCLVGAIINRNFELLKGFLPIIIIALGAIAMITVALNFMEIKGNADDFNDEADESEFEIDIEYKVGIGVYLGLIGSILVIVGGVLLLLKKEEAA